MGEKRRGAPGICWLNDLAGYDLLLVSQERMHLVRVQLSLRLDENYCSIVQKILKYQLVYILPLLLQWEHHGEMCPGNAVLNGSSTPLVIHSSL
jgi:hypothetical protein